MGASSVWSPFWALCVEMTSAVVGIQHFGKFKNLLPPVAPGSYILYWLSHLDICAAILVSLDSYTLLNDLHLWELWVAGSPLSAVLKWRQPLWVFNTLRSSKNLAPLPPCGLPHDTLCSVLTDLCHLGASFPRCWGLWPGQSHYKSGGEIIWNLGGSRVNSIENH